MDTLRCLINGGGRGGGENKSVGQRFLLNLINVVSKFKINPGGGVGISKNRLISVMNEKRDIKYLILMLNLKVNKKTRSEASKNKVIIKRVSNISIN